MSQGNQQFEKMILQNMKKDVNGKRDLCSIYQNKAFLDALIPHLASPYRGKVDYVAAPESLGFILGSMLANELQVGFIPIRNGNNFQLDDEGAIKAAYIDHNNKVRSLAIRKDVIDKGSRVLLADDWISTAATIQSCLTIVEEAESTVAGVASFGIEANDATKNLIESGLAHFIVCHQD